MQIDEIKEHYENHFDLTGLKTGVVDDMYIRWGNELVDSQQKELKELREENERLEGGLRISINQLNNVPCFQGCQGGGIQTSEDDFEQCQWCGEQEYIKGLLNK